MVDRKGNLIGEDNRETKPKALNTGLSKVKQEMQDRKPQSPE